MLVSFVLTPISYRGYVYTSIDSKHCYYYLGSRFYSPLLSRFLNADSIPDTGTGVVGTNMFAYCNNSPVLLIDPNGKLPINIPLLIASIAVGGFLYLGLYNNMLCLRLFQWSFTNRKSYAHYDFSSGKNNWTKLLQKRLKDSSVLSVLLVSFINLNLKDKNSDSIEYPVAEGDYGPSKVIWDFYSFPEKPSIADYDLAWSIGGLSGKFTITVSRISKNKYQVTYKLKDELWDFDEWEKDDHPEASAFTRTINNMGSFIEDMGASNPFYWSFKISFVFKV